MGQSAARLLLFLQTPGLLLCRVTDRTAVQPHSFLATQRLYQYHAMVPTVFHAMALNVRLPHSLQVPRLPRFPATDQTAAPKLVLPLSL